MAVKLPDTLVPMADFPSAFAKDVQFTDGENLQDKLDKGKLGSSSSGTGLTEEQANNIEKIPSIEGIVTSNSQAIENKADKDHEHTEYLTEIPDEYVTDTELSTELDKKVNKEEGKGLSTNDLTNELVIKIDSSATEAFVTNAIANAQLGDKEVDLSGYATVDALNLKADLTHTHDQYLTEVPDEYITETELTDKNYADKEYVTQAVSNVNVDLTEYAKTSDIPTKVSQLTNDSNFITTIPEEYITDTELSSKGYATETFVTDKIAEASLSGSGVDLSGYATKDDVPTKTSELTNDSGFINSDDLPTVPTKVSDLANDSNFVTNSKMLEAMADLILDTEVRIDKTYSSSKIYADIQQCLEDSKTYTLEEIARASTASYKVVTDVVDMTEERYLYLLYDGTTNYDIYIVEADGTPAKIGNTQIDLNNYYTKTEIDNDFLKKVNADSKYATITTVDGKIDKDKIVTILDDTVTDEQVASAKAVYDELTTAIGKKANTSDIPTKVSELTNDSNYQTAKQVNSAVTTEIAKVETKLKLINLGENADADNCRIANGDITDAYSYCGLFTQNVPMKGYAVIRCYHYCGGIRQFIDYTTGSAKTYTRFIQYDGKFSTAWKELATMDKLNHSTVADVGVTTITPVNSAITGIIEYTVKNGICYVSMNDLMSTISSTNLVISNTMPKPSINCASLSVDAGGSITRIYIDKNTTKLYGNFYTKNAKSRCSFSYPVAES